MLEFAVPQTLGDCCYKIELGSGLGPRHFIEISNCTFAANLGSTRVRHAVRQSEKTGSCRENLWNEMQLKGP